MARGNTGDYVATTVARLEALITGCGFQRLGDLNALRAAEWLATVQASCTGSSSAMLTGTARS